MDAQTFRYLITKPNNYNRVTINRQNVIMKWVIVMEYSVNVRINKPVAVVTELFVNKQLMQRWETNLVRIEESETPLFSTGSHGVLVFNNDGNELRMTVSVTENDLPNTISLVYEVPGAYNRCLNRFASSAEGTSWTMDVLFRFETDVDIPIELFISKTTENMNRFKKFVEEFMAVGSSS